jgi:hypothetical protein
MERENMEKQGKVIGGNKKSDELCDLAEGMRKRVRMIGYLLSGLWIRIRINLSCGCGSGCGSRRPKMTYKYRNKNFHVLKG